MLACWPLWSNVDTDYTFPSGPRDGGVPFLDPWDRSNPKLLILSQGRWFKYFCKLGKGFTTMPSKGWLWGLTAYYVEHTVTWLFRTHCDVDRAENTLFSKFVTMILMSTQWNYTSLRLSFSFALWGWNNILPFAHRSHNSRARNVSQWVCCGGTIVKHDPGKRLCGTSAAISWGRKSQEPRLEMTVLEKLNWRIIIQGGFTRVIWWK